MASTYSTLKFELITPGEQSGSWGTTTNVNLGTAIEEAIVGRATANFSTDNDLTLTLTDANTTQVARNFILDVTTSTILTGTRNLIVPTINKPYLVENNTGYPIQVKTAAGTGVTIPIGKRVFVYANHTNVVQAEDYLPTLTVGGAFALTGDQVQVSEGGTGASTLTGIVKGNGASAFTAAASGTDYAPGTSALATGIVKSTTTTGALSIAAAGSDFVAPGAITSSGLTQATNKLLGRTTASTGAVEEISVGTGLALSGGSLTNTGVSAIWGTYKNLQASATGSSATVSVSCDQIALYDGSLYKIVSSVSLSIAGTTTGANALDTGTIAASTWYSVWVINNGSTTAGLLSLSATAPTMPSGYTYKTRIGWVRTDATNKYPLAFKQYGNKVQYVVTSAGNVTGMPLVVSGAQGTVNVAPTWATASVVNFVPSTAAEIALFVRAAHAAGAGVVYMIAPNGNYAGITSYNTISTTNPPIDGISVADNTYGGTYTKLITMMLESTDIYIASSATVGVHCSGWIDNL